MEIPVQSARLRVFDTTELLEAILLEIDDPYSILRAQRVNSTFLACVENSPVLRQRLWLTAPSDKKNKSQQEITLNPFIFKDDTRYHTLPNLLLRTIGLGQGFNFSEGLKPKLKFHQIDVKCCQKAMDGSTPSFLRMYLQRPTDQPIKLLVGGLHRPARLQGVWNHAHMIVMQQPFGDLIALGLGLRLLADHMQKTVWKTPWQLPYNQWTEVTELEQPEKEVWEKFFTTEQRDTMVSVPFISERWDR